jgi:soluble P-type ATPase
MAKDGILIEIPGLGQRHIGLLLSDFSGTLSSSGRVYPAVKEMLIQLAEEIDVHVVTSDTYGTVQSELEGLPLALHLLHGDRHDLQKEELGRRLGLEHCAVLGNGNNDRLLLKAAKEAGGIAIAVDNGEGCATDALLNSNLFIVGAVGALRLLLDPRSCKATLRC